MEKNLGVYVVGDKIIHTGGMSGYIDDPCASFGDYDVIEVVVS